MSDEDIKHSSDQREVNNALLNYISKIMVAASTAVIGLLLTGVVAAIVDHQKLGQVQTQVEKMTAIVEKAVSDAQVARERVDTIERKVQAQNAAYNYDKITFTEIDHWSYQIQAANNSAGIKVIIPEPKHKQ